ncbi:MAG: LacI family DNA-binding transcriptional regulator [Chthonomonadales bacterium]|nr:LacI family DNA-binding transcriptional regulator [Chthonomonadales bacterium]
MRRTLKQIATELKVSPMTVSRALRGAPGVGEETAARIREYARSVHYRPDQAARSLVARRARAFGIIVPNLRHSFWLDMVIGVECVARAAGYQVFISHAADDPRTEREEIRALVSRRVDALLVASCDPDANADLMWEAEAGGVPVVLFDRHGERIAAPGVYADDAGGARQATAHLAGIGYRRIAHLAGDLRYSPARLRVAGYEATMHERGLTPLVREAGFGEPNGHRGMHALLEARAPEAVFVSHDPSAIGALHAALERGLRVPEDVAIVGFGDIECAAHVAVPLTTVSQPKVELGEALGALALRRIAGQACATERVVLPTHLVVRRSCGALPRSVPPEGERL